ncbi:MAG: pilus assembly protein [Selenomonadaceae bacterium]|nr:pilus assembly protein [Selenomonadaceae bacterium]
MFKISTRNKIKSLNRRGQVLVFYALLIPLMFMFAGIGLDLGWYYLNVSRLQNAADAAALAGAQAFVDDDENFPTITAGALLTNNMSFNSEKKYFGSTSGEQATIETANDLAEEYAVKNLGNMKEIIFETAEATETKNSIIDSWSKSKEDVDRVVTPDYSFYDYGTSFYYVVRLNEKIEHLFMPGWFPSMNAPVVAVAKLAQTPKMQTIINSNVIVGNWEVQEFYRKQALEYEKDENGNFVMVNGKKVPVYATEKDGSPILNADGEQMQDYIYTNQEKYIERFGFNFYSGAWNHFQDFFHHYAAGDFYRTETITVRDDVNYSSEKPYGANSSVAGTSASINLKPGHAYNPGTSARKTYKDGINDTGTIGLPYTWDKLDSINIDFKPEVGFSTDSSKASYKWLSEDWDLWMDNTDVSFNNRKWSTKGNVITQEDVKRMRVHASINFEEPYKERTNELYLDRDEKGNLLPDILWCRVESEPMLSHPDAVNGYTSFMNKTVTGLNSVRQIIINANKSNYDTAAQKYRPIVIFYDGPERYSTENSIRDSKPVILNLKEPFRGILYAPNSPVVVIGDKKDKFIGFVVAKSYLRLKDDNDFESGGYKYFNNTNKEYEYTREEDSNGKVTYRDNNGKVKNDRTDANTVKVEYFYDKYDTSENKTKYYKITDENGIEMYIDENGEIQYAPLNHSNYKCGEYDNFGRTDFTTHDYHINQTSATNLLLSGN